MIRSIALLTSLLALAACAGNQQARTSAPADPRATAAEESLTPPGVRSELVDSRSKPEKEPKVAEGSCEENSASRECKCQRGDTNACLKVARDAFRHHDHDQAIIQTYSLCQQGSSDACFQAAHYMKKMGIQQRLGTSPAKLEDKGVAIDKEGCANGDAAACFGHGKRLFTGKFVAIDSQLGKEHLETACSGGHARACSYLANAYEGGTGGLKKDKKRALELLEASCNSGRVASCTYLGDMIAQTNKVKAQGLYEKSCSADYAAGCSRLGQVHLNAEKFNEAHAAFAKACELDDFARCVSAGSLTESGKGTTKDPVKARELYKVACDEELGAGCLSLANLIGKGLGGHRNWGQAIDLSNKACSLDFKEACAEVSRLKRNPPDWRCDTEAACEAFCDERLGKSCTRLGELRAEKETAESLEEGEGEGTWPSCEGANDAYRRGCEEGDGIGCYRIRKYEEACAAGVADGCALAQAAWYKVAKAPEKKKIIRNLTRACARLNAEACFKVTELIERENPTRAKRLVERLCRAGNGPACAAEADFVPVANHGMGDGMCFVGNAPFRQQCSRKQLGEAAKRNGANIRRQTKILSKACQRGHFAACFHDDFDPVTAEKMADQGRALLKVQSCGRGGVDR